MEVNVRNVPVDIIYHQLQHVQHAQVNHNVPPVHKLQMLVPLVRHDFIQVVKGVLLAPRFIQNVLVVLPQLKHVPLVQVDIMLQGEPVPRVPVKWQTAPHVPQMEVNVRNVQLDIIQMGNHVNYAIQFTKNVPDVLPQQRHVPLVQADIMSQEEVVPRVPVKWQTAPHVHQMEVNVRNVRVDIIQMEPHVNYVIQ